ncbi:hypothetical protein BD779DRAFT_1802309 [Infundibulicybe gibba]|nr:hypothetical protein BD779DRAFT_1802309 [Infundibulicybe gibba]
MSPAAITIPALSVASPASPTSPGLYVPIHKRSSSASPSSSRAVSPARLDRAVPTTPAHPFIYSRAQLMAFSNSPLAHMTPETREDLKARFPPLFLSRKQRKAIEYHARTAETAAAPTPKAAQPAQQQQQRRNVRPGRAPPARRNATKVIDQLSWRGRALAPMSLPTPSPCSSSPSPTQLTTIMMRIDTTWTRRLLLLHYHPH